MSMTDSGHEGLWKRRRTLGLMVLRVLELGAIGLLLWCEFARSAAVTLPVTSPLTWSHGDKSLSIDVNGLVVRDGEYSMFLDARTLELVFGNELVRTKVIPGSIFISRDESGECQSHVISLNSLVMQGGTNERLHDLFRVDCVGGYAKLWMRSSDGSAFVLPKK